MPSLKDLKTQINSVGSTKKITSAMKMVAASKLKKSQEKSESAKPYSERIEEILYSLSKSNVSGEGVIKLLKGNNKDEKYLIIPVTADRGLCGGFNSSINRESTKYIRELEKKGKNVNLITIGKKSRDFFKRIMSDKIMESYVDMSIRGITYSSAFTISKNIQKLYSEEKFDVCIIIYNKFKSAITQEVTKKQLIPLKIEKQNNDEENDQKKSNSIYKYEPDEKEILTDLLPKNISVQIFKILLESDAGEPGARMAAMDNATRNAGEMIDNLTLKYNRPRQAFITKELIEIISGAESIQ